MEPLEFLKSTIAGFPGYADETDRQRSDEMVRSFLGEAIADLEVRLVPPEGGVSQRIGDLLIRVGFTNQSAYKRYEDGARSGADFAGMSASDEEIVELAGRAPSIDGANLSSYLDEIVAALDRRDATMDGEPVSYT